MRAAVTATGLTLDGRSVHGNPLAVADLPPAERPRARLRRLGAEALTNAELLSIALGTACESQADAGIGECLLAAAGGSLRRLPTESASVLDRVPGIGPKRIDQLDAMFELARRWATETPIARPIMRTPSDIVTLYRLRLQDLTFEEFHVAALDTQHGFERDICISRGLLSTCPVHAREVFLGAVEARAAALVLVHNHPSGDPTPSAEDHDLTRRLVIAGRTLDIPIYDHIIIGRGRHVSFLENQWI